MFDMVDCLMITDKVYYRMLGSELNFFIKLARTDYF